MDTHMIIEMVGYLGSALVLVSFLMASVVKLRVINSIGGAIFAVYALIIQSYPTALMNICLVIINIYYLMKLRKTDQQFELVEGTVMGGKVDDPTVDYFLKHYQEDIRKFFTDFSGDVKGADTAYLVCADGTLAGLLLGKKQKDHSLRVFLDYSTPVYRDCSVGAYLYSRLPREGIRSLAFSRASKGHEDYLKKMGFVKKGGEYVKELL